MQTRKNKNNEDEGEDEKSEPGHHLWSVDYVVRINGGDEVGHCELFIARFVCVDHGMCLDYHTAHYRRSFYLGKSIIFPGKT